MILLDLIRARRAELKRADVTLMSNSELWHEILAGIREFALLPDDIVDRLEQAGSGLSESETAPPQATQIPDDDLARMSEEELWAHIVRKTNALVADRLGGTDRGGPSIRDLRDNRADLPAPERLKPRT